MDLSWILGWKKEGEKRRTLNEIRETISQNYKEYAKREYPYRIFSSVYIFSLVVILGVVAYENTVVTYRAPFPTGEDKTNVSASIEVSLAVTDSSLLEIGEEVKKYLDISLEKIDLPDSVKIQGKVSSYKRSLSSVLSDASTPTSLDLFIALVPSKEWTHFSATSVLLTKGKWSIVQIREDEDISKILARIDQLVFEVLIGTPHLELIVKRDGRERMESWHIATMSPQHQKRLRWDCNALSSSYSLRLVHLHTSCSSPSSCLPSSIHSTLIPSINRFASLLKDVTTLNVKSEHLFDLHLHPFLEEDVQGRQVITHHNIHLLLKEIDSLASATQSIEPQLKMVVIHSDSKIVLVDGDGEDVSGASVSEWGGVIVSDGRVTSNVLSSVRMLLGIDSQLPPSFKRESAPISQWELTRLWIRNIVDSSLRTKHSIQAMRSLIKDIDNLVFSRELSSLISASIAHLSSSFSNARMPSLDGLKNAVINAERALMDKSLLSLLYFPTEQKFGIFLPLIALYFAPALFLLPRIIHYAIFRG